MIKPKYFVEYTVRIGQESQSIGDYSDVINKPEHFISECSAMLSNSKGYKEDVVFLYEDKFDDECLLMYTFDGDQSEDSVYVKFYNFQDGM